jgi:hypothetical protein
MHNITWSSTVLVKSWLPFDEFINFYNTGQPLSYSNLELLTGKKWLIGTYRGAPQMWGVK